VSLPTQQPSADPFLAALPVVAGHRVAPPCAILQKLGEGAAGVVYRGVHLNLEIDVAVKFLRPEVAQHDDQVSRFLREARIAASIRHENLVSVYDTVARDATYYTVMELIEGETLHDRVARKGQLPVDEALALVAMALRGLTALHKRGVVHRDVKPTNIIISGAGEVKLSDLGIARASLGDSSRATLQTHADALIGTPQYMAPEQFRSANDVEVRSDVFSMAGVLWFCLAGDHAIRGESLAEVMHNICTQPYPPMKLKRPDVPMEVANLLAHATHADVKARPTSREMLDRVLAILHARGVPSPESAVPDVHARGDQVAHAAPSIDKTTLRSIQREASSLAMKRAPTIPPTKQEVQSGSKGKIIAMAVVGVAGVVVSVAYWLTRTPPEAPSVASFPTSVSTTQSVADPKPEAPAAPIVLKPIEELGIEPTDPTQKQRWQELQTILEDLSAPQLAPEKRAELLNEAKPRAMALAEDLTITSKAIHLAAGRVAIDGDDKDLAAEVLVALRQMPKDATDDEPTQKLMARLSRLALPGYMTIVELSRPAHNEDVIQAAEQLRAEQQGDLFEYSMYDEARRVLTVSFHRLKGSQLDLQQLYAAWLRDGMLPQLRLESQKARMRVERARLFLKWKTGPDAFEPRYDDAIFDLNYALEGNRLQPPERYDAMIDRGRAHAAKEEPDEAMPDLSAVISAADATNEQKALALGHRGIAWGQKDIGLGASLDFMQALKLEGVSEDTRAWIRTLMALEKLRIPKKPGE
jgi:serine/threonine protein kinase